MNIYYDIRDKHILVIGKTGQGKTTLLSDHALADIDSRMGAVVVIDPKGGKNSFAEIVARYIPEDRVKDCVWIDMENPLPLDFMSGAKEGVVADLTYILTKGVADASAWELNRNLKNILHALVNANEQIEEEEKRCTLLDVYDYFIDEKRRQFILDHLADERLKADLTGPQKPDRQGIGRLMNRVNDLARSPTMQKVLGDPRPRLNIPKFLDEKGILLVSLDERNPSSADYGSLLVAKIQHAMFARGDSVYEPDRIPCFLYIDEFREFRASEKFEKMLTMARSFKLCLTLADLSLNLIKDKDVVNGLKVIDNYILLKSNDDDINFFKSRFDEKDDRGRLEDQLLKLQEQWMMEGMDPEHPAGYRIRNLETYLRKIPKTVTKRDAHGLQKFQVIYMLSDQDPAIEWTPDPPPPRATKAEEEKIARIKARSLKDYGPRPKAAEIRLIRNPHPTPLHSTSIPHDKGDDIREPEIKDHRYKG